MTNGRVLVYELMFTPGFCYKSNDFDGLKARQRAWEQLLPALVERFPNSEQSLRAIRSAQLETAWLTFAHKALRGETVKGWRQFTRTPTLGNRYLFAYSCPLCPIRYNSAPRQQRELKKALRSFDWHWRRNHRYHLNQSYTAVPTTDVSRALAHSLACLEETLKNRVARQSGNHS